MRWTLAFYTTCHQNSKGQVTLHNNLKTLTDYCTAFFALTKFKLSIHADGNTKHTLVYEFDILFLDPVKADLLALAL